MRILLNKSKRKSDNKKILINMTIIDLCEIKYSVRSYIIDKSYDEDLRNKIKFFRESTGTNKSIQLVMVTTYGVKENKGLWLGFI